MKRKIYMRKGRKPNLLEGWKQTNFHNADWEVFVKDGNDDFVIFKLVSLKPVEHKGNYSIEYGFDKNFNRFVNNFQFKSLIKFRPELLQLFCKWFTTAYGFNPNLPE